MRVSGDLRVASLTLFFVGLKAILLLGLARAYVMNESLQKQWLFLSLLYTAILAALSWVFILQTHPGMPDQWWQLWLLKSFLLVVAYFKLLSYFEEGILFWIIFLGGWLALVWF